MYNNTVEDRKAMQRVICMMILFYLVQSYGSYPGLFGLPLTIHLKDKLGLSPAQLATFSSVTFIPWLIRPLYGIIEDTIPIFGYQFKSYFLICYTLAFTVLLGLSNLQFSTIASLTGGVILVNTAIAFSDVLTDKIMVVQGKLFNNTALLQAIQWTALSIGQAVLYFVGGWLAKNSSLSTTFLITAGVPFIGLIGVLILLADEKKQPKTGSFKRGLKSLWVGVRSRQFLTALGFIACLQFTLIPSLVNYIIYYQKDNLNFDPQFIGILGTFEAIANALGAIAFGLFSSRISRRWLLNLAIGFTTIATLGLIFIHDTQSAILTSLFFGFFSMIAMLGVLEIAARACPVGAEGSTYAVFMSMYHLVKQPGTILGGYLFGLGVPVSTLVIISAGFTALCWFLIPLFKLAQNPD